MLSQYFTGFFRRIISLCHRPLSARVSDSSIKQNRDSRFHFNYRKAFAVLCISTSVVTGSLALWTPTASAVVVTSRGAESPNFLYGFSGYVVSQSRLRVTWHARLNVRLLDVTHPAHPITVASSTRILRRAIPMPFNLDYHPTRIHRTHRYALAVDIRSARGTLLWRNKGLEPVHFDARNQILGSPFVIGVSRG